MAGLLDKASEKSTETNSEDNAMQEPTPETDAKGGLLSQTESGEITTPSSPKEKQPPVEVGSPMFSGIGIVLLFVSMYGLYNLRVVPGIIVVPIFLSSYALFTYGMKTWKGSFSSDKFIAFGVVWLLLGAVPYLAAFDFTAIGNLAISEIEIDEDNDQLEFYIYTSIGDAIEVGVEYDGTEVWNSSVVATSGKKRIEVSFSEFYQGNALDGSGTEVHSYTITVNAGGTSDESAIPNSLMTRLVENAGGELYTVSEYNDDTGTKDHLGVILSANLGLLHPSMTRETGGDTNRYSSLINPVVSDYSFSINITYAGVVVWSSAVVSVDGDIATWSGGTGDLSSGWVTLDGTTTGTIGGIDISYLDRDDFYQGDGCYTMEVVVTHEVWPSSLGENSLVDDNAAFEFFWEYNEDEDRSGAYKPAIEC